MNKIKFLTYLTIGLFITNGVLFYFLISAHKSKGGPKNLIIDKLHFDKEQVEKYEAFIKQHRKAISENETKINMLKSKLYEQLQNPKAPAKTDSLMVIIARQQVIAEQINYHHFLEIKDLCKPSQQKDFNALTKEIVNLFATP